MSTEVDAASFAILEGNLGSLLIVSFLNAVLYGILCLQCYLFSQVASEKKRRQGLLKYSVWLLWLLNTVHLVCSMHQCYWYMVLDFGNAARALTIPPWSGATLFLISAMSNFIVQGWFTWRVYVLTNRNRWVLAFLVVFVFATFVFGEAVAIVGLLSPTIQSIAAENFLIYICDSLDVFTNLVLSAALCRSLLQLTSPLPQTRNLVNMLIVYTVNTGLLGLAISACSMILRIALPNSLVYYAEYIPYSQLYTNALLGSLNARDWFRNDSQVVSIPLSNLSGPSRGSHRGSSNVMKNAAATSTDGELAVHGDVDSAVKVTL